LGKLDPAFGALDSPPFKAAMTGSHKMPARMLAMPILFDLIVDPSTSAA
jgi:hypothetical protein